MFSPLVGRSIAPAAAAVNYFSLGSNFGNGGQTVEANVQHAMPFSGVLRNFYINQTSGAPGAGTSVAWEVLKNGVATGMIATIADTVQTAADTTNVVSFVQGDKMSLRSTPTNTPATTVTAWSFEVSATSQLLLTTSNNGATSTGAATYVAMENGTGVAASTDMAGTFPTNGTVSLATLLASAAPGASKSWTLTFVKNGTDTALTTSLTGTSQVTNTDTTNSISVSAGDTGYWRIDPAGTPATARVKISYAFTPTIDGESIHFYDTSTALSSASAACYAGIGGGALANTTVPGTRANWYGTSWDFKKLYASVDVAPGASASWIVALRLSTAAQSLTTTITDPATSNSDLTHTSTPAMPGLISVTFLGSGTPTLTQNHWSYVTYRAPTSNFLGLM